MTQIEQANKGIITPEAQAVAACEGVGVNVIMDGIAAGTIVIPRNLGRPTRAVGVGAGLSVKVNANIGTSRDRADLSEEITKLRAALEGGAHTIMDLSTGGELANIRRAILENCPVPLGTVPIYQVAAEAAPAGKSFLDTTPDDWFKVIGEHGKEGVDFITVHCGVTRDNVRKLREQGRELDIVSRGGALTAHWMDERGEENPFYAQFDRLVEIAYQYDMTLSLGDGLRPGCIADATDRGQLAELITLGELQARAFAAGVQVMIEGPGHVPLDQIEANIQLEKRLCHGAPFYVLGPLVTDIAPGYDHITSAIGGALAAWAGADFLCYVTPSEHLRLPTTEDVRMGVITARIAAHAADIARRRPAALVRDLRMARARKNLDWETQIETSIDPKLSRRVHESLPSHDSDVCSMCSELCAIKIAQKKAKI